MILRKWEYIAMRWQAEYPEDEFWVAVCLKFDAFLKERYPSHTDSWAEQDEDELNKFEISSIACAEEWCSACDANTYYDPDDEDHEFGRIDCSSCGFGKRFGICSHSTSLFSDLIQALHKREEKNVGWIRKLEGEEE